MTIASRSSSSAAIGAISSSVITDIGMTGMAAACSR
jgi:hypothetical protein